MSPSSQSFGLCRLSRSQTRDTFHHGGHQEQGMYASLSIEGSVGRSVDKISCRRIHQRQQRIRKWPRLLQSRLRMQLMEHPINTKKRSQTSSSVVSSRAVLNWVATDMVRNSQLLTSLSFTGRKCSVSSNTTSPIICMPINLKVALKPGSVS